MKRYITKERPLTPEEQQATYRARIIEAQEEVDLAVARLRDAINEAIPTTTTEYIEVKLGEPGYDDAPFQNSLIVIGQEMRFQIASNPSPWTDMIKGGRYPSGLGDL